MNKPIGLLLLLIAYGLLFPGLTQPLLSLTGTVEKADLAQIGKDIIVENPDTPEVIGTMAEILIANMHISGTIEAYEKTNSVIGMVEELHGNGYTLVAVLIATFSIVIPTVKGLMLMFSYFQISPGLSRILKSTTNVLSKWSMADVFVIGVFVSFLAVSASQKEGSLLEFSATLGSGFYFFLGYCLLSIFATQLLLAGDEGLGKRPG